MISRKVIITNPSGVHARPASIFVREAGKCKSSVTIKVGEKSIQGKSILNVMAAAIKCGTEIELCCDGENEAEELETLAQLVESGLGE